MPTRIIPYIDWTMRTVVLLAIGFSAYWAFFDRELPLVNISGQAVSSEVHRNDYLEVAWNFVQRRASCIIHVHRIIISNGLVNSEPFARILPEQIITLEPTVLPYPWSPIVWGRIQIPKDMPLGPAYDKVLLCGSCNPVQQLLPERLQICMEPSVVKFNVLPEDPTHKPQHELSDRFGFGKPMP